MTVKQSRLYAYLVEFIGRFGHSPSIRQISADLGYRSIGGIHGRLLVLEKAGYIRIPRARHRSIEILDRPEVTTAAARLLAEAKAEGESITVPAEALEALRRALVSPGGEEGRP